MEHSKNWMNGCAGNCAQYGGDGKGSISESAVSPAWVLRKARYGVAPVMDASRHVGAGASHINAAYSR